VTLTGTKPDRRNGSERDVGYWHDLRYYRDADCHYGHRDLHHRG